MARTGRKKSRERLRKAVDETMTVRSKSAQLGLIREEVWVDSKNEVVRYNLAYINFQLCQADNGRVLGYDNAHGFHERHWMGKAEKVDFRTYRARAEAFFEEVQELRERS